MVTVFSGYNRNDELNFGFVVVNCSVQKQYEQAKDEATKASQETERLLQVVQMTQEEQNAKEKTIMDLQQ